MNLKALDQLLSDVQSELKKLEAEVTDLTEEQAFTVMFGLDEQWKQLHSLMDLHEKLAAVASSSISPDVWEEYANLSQEISYIQIFGHDSVPLTGCA